MNQTLDTNFKGGIMITLSQVLYKNQIHQKSFHYQVCKEFYSMVPVVLYFPKNSYLVESLNRKLEAFATAGLIQYWASVHTNMKYLNLRFTNTGPKKLSLSHLSGIIQILIGGLVLSTVGFAGELLWARFRNSRMKKVFPINIK